MADQIAPLQGFGDDTNTSIKFSMVADRSNIAPTWRGGKPRINQWEIPGGDRIVTQIDGSKPTTLTLLLEFDSSTDLEIMAGLVGTRATLRYTLMAGRRVGGTVQTLLGHQYLVLPNTLLLDLDDDSFEIDGPCQATATFQRAGETSSYYGFATYGEDDE